MLAFCHQNFHDHLLCKSQGIYEKCSNGMPIKNAQVSADC